MATWDSRDEARSRGVNRDLIRVMQLAYKRYPGRVAVTEGLRTQQRQRELVAKGASKTMNSKHLTGRAIDVVIINPDGTANWTPRAYTEFARVVAQAASELGVAVRWGGSWRWISGPDAHDFPFIGAKFFDGPHFEV